MNIPIYACYVNLLLLSVGIFTLLNKQSIIFIIIGIELLVQSAISNCIFFNRLHAQQPEGLVLATFITALSVCEMVLFIAISLNLCKQYKIYNLNSNNIASSISEEPS